MKQIATDIYTFEELINDNYIYVDKTKYLYRLINKTRGKQFFLSRPRRFGKSLLLSTIQCIFEGKRELFKDLYIDSADYDWQAYPVIRLDMNNTAANSVEETEEAVKNQLRWNYINHGIKCDEKAPARKQFEDLIRILAYKSPHKQVVVLIDEYDKPLLNHLGKKEVIPFQQFLKQFYGVVKSTESYQRFCLMTGVSKFSKVSIFSDLNNLNDLTMSPFATEICGYTHKEVKHYFSEHIEALASAYSMTKEEAFYQLCKMYDGYKFSEKCPQLFNPVSLGNCLSTSEFGNYWFETGTPGGLMDYLKTHPIKLANFSITPSKLGTYNPQDPGIVPLLFQTGYLTIKDTIGKLMVSRYILDFPNMEVKDGFNNWLVEAYAPEDAVDSGQLSQQTFDCAIALQDGNVDEFIDIFKTFVAGIPYHLLKDAQESQYQTIMYTFFYSVSSSIFAEINTNLGRIDVVMETDDYVYVIELKLDKSAKEALDQIKDKRYYEKYMRQDKQLALLGINFSSKTRNVDDYACEKV